MGRPEPGHHATELPASSNAVSYAFGFVVATGLLHGIGIGIGEVTRSPQGVVLLRLIGTLIAIVGAWFILPQLTGG